MKTFNRVGLIFLVIFVLISCRAKKTSELYVSYKTKQKDKSQFTVFVKDRKIDTLYYGFEIGLERDTSDLVYTNQYRLQKADIYTFNNSTMVKTGLAVLTKGENEFVYKIAKKVDFTGGYHGDEQIIEISFIADNKIINLNKPFKLRPFKNFKYIQNSTFHESASIEKGVNKQHPIEATHFKTTSFGENGYKTVNTIKWEKNLVLDKIYGSLVCLSRDFGGFGKSNTRDTVNFDLKGGLKLKSRDKSITIWNIQNRTKAFIESDFSIMNDSSFQWIWDHKVYNKYYRDTGKINAVKNDIWTFSTKVKFEQLE